MTILDTVGRFPLVIGCTIAGLMIGGCQKQGPVELIDSDGLSQDLELMTLDRADTMYEPNDLDDSQFFPPVNRTSMGRLVVQGSLFEVGNEHHEASMAHAIFFKRIALLGGTVLTAISAGEIRVDQLGMDVVAKRIVRAQGDTTVGIQYALVSVDGVGGRGFQYLGNHEYQWTGLGGLQIQPFQCTIRSPEKLQITSPQTGSSISASQNLRVRWQGGGKSVEVLIRNAEPGSGRQPVMQFRLRSNQGGVLIPSSILRGLPTDRSEFLFTFSSTEQSTIQIGGYAEEVVVLSRHSHTVLYRLNR
jgi:hypothetical protein